MIILTSQAARVMARIREALPPKAQRVAFITTAGNPDLPAPWIEEDRSALAEAGFEIRPIDVAVLVQRELKAALSSADIIFVAGGNTFYLLQESRKSGFLEMLPQLLEEGRHYIGSSAGSLLVGPSLSGIHALDDRTKAPELSSDEALGIVPFVPFVHFGNDQFFDPYLEAFKATYREKHPILSIRDDELVIWENDSLIF